MGKVTRETPIMDLKHHQIEEIRERLIKIFNETSSGDELFEDVEYYLDRKLKGIEEGINIYNLVTVKVSK